MRPEKQPGLKRDALVEELASFSHIFTHVKQEELLKLYELASMKPNSIIVEIGSYLGASSCYLALACKHHNSRLYCVDTWENQGMSEGQRDTYDEFLSNTKPLCDYITPLRGFSTEIGKQFHKKIALLFVDGDHSYEGVKKDWEIWKDKLQADAIVIFHDWLWEKGVKKLICEEVEPYIKDNGNLHNLWWGTLDGEKMNKQSQNPSRQSYHEKKRNINKLADEFRSCQIPVAEDRIDTKDFLQWMNEYQDLARCCQKSGDVFIEKCLEHYLSARLMNLRPGDVYIDVAGASSNFAEVLSQRGISAYQLDLSYPQGIHGRKIGADAGDTRLADQSVQGLSLQCAFECFEGDADIRFIREAQRILKRSGKLVIAPLYVDHEYFILTSRACNQDEIEFDEGALRVWREDVYKAPFSRHYSPRAFCERIVRQIHPESQYKIICYTNLDELKKIFPDQRIYCDLVFYLEKTGHPVVRPVPLSAEGPNLSVVIPTRNRADSLEKTLLSLLHQSVSSEKFEILVIDNGSMDKTQQVYEACRGKFGQIRYFYEPDPGLHAGRHRGALEAQSEILCYLDDDVRVTSGWLAAIQETFATTDAVLVGGKVMPEYEAAPPDWIRQFLQPVGDFGYFLGQLSLIDLGEQIRPIDPVYVWGCNFSIRKEILFECGGFRPDSMPKELLQFRGDGETGLSREIQRRGYKAYYHPGAVIYHRIPKERLTVEYFCKRMFSQGISDSYTEIRSQKNHLDPVLTRIQDAYQEGRLFHRKQAISDPQLLPWILKENYYPAIRTKTNERLCTIRE